MAGASAHAPFWSITRWVDKLSILLFFAVWELARASFPELKLKEPKRYF